MKWKKKVNYFINEYVEGGDNLHISYNNIHSLPNYIINNFLMHLMIGEQTDS